MTKKTDTTELGNMPTADAHMVDYIEDVSRLQLRLANLVEAASSSGRPPKDLAEEACLNVKTVRQILKRGTDADPKALTLISLSRALGLDERGLKK